MKKKHYYIVVGCYLWCATLFFRNSCINSLFIEAHFFKKTLTIRHTTHIQIVFNYYFEQLTFSHIQNQIAVLMVILFNPENVLSLSQKSAFSQPQVYCWSQLERLNEKCRTYTSMSCVDIISIIVQIKCDIVRQ